MTEIEKYWKFMLYFQQHGILLFRGYDILNV